MKISKTRQLIFKTKKTIENNAPMILSCIGTAGTVATVVLTAKATFKAADVIKELEEENETVELADKIKQVGPLLCSGSNNMSYYSNVHIRS